MASLIERLRAARESWVTAPGGMQFLVRRPTAMQVAAWQGEPMSDWLRRCLVGWRVGELDLVPGGDDKVPPFDADVCVEWMEDRPEVYHAVVEALVGRIRAHQEQLAGDEKNSAAPSNPSPSGNSGAHPPLPPTS